MTKIESAILDILKVNARLPFSEVAALAGVDEKTVKATVKKLEKHKIISRYTTVINEDNLPQKDTLVRALIEVRVRPERKTGFDAIAKRIARYKNVQDHFLISGTYDFLVIVEGQTLQEVSRFVSDKLASIDNVIGTSTHFIMKKYKEHGCLMEDDVVQDRLAVSP
ncbi:MAG: Lrp/AsnC family transcriptional regulator [Candidatus Margulisiibacteriota bacterium]